MDTSHVEVEDKLVALLHRLNVVQPPVSLLGSAYQSLVVMLSAEHGAAFEQDYLKTQLGYQNANDALYRWEIQNGPSTELKDFARQVLPKIDDHRQQVMALSAAKR